MRFNNKKVTSLLLTLEGLGAVFAAIFLSAYLGGLPSTEVLHSETVFRVPLVIFGAALLFVIFLLLILTSFTNKE